MQVLYVSAAQNQLTGTFPVGWSSLLYLGMSSNKLSQMSWDKLPTGLQILYLADNALAGTVSALNLPVNLTLLDISHNLLSGILPDTLPPNLSVLNISYNSFTSTLPSSWSRLSEMAELRIDHNALKGKLPSSWSAWGGNTQNSLQLSILSNPLQGRVPRQWVQQFCLNIVKSAEVRLLFQPPSIQVLGQQFSTGGAVELSAQHASINVTLGGRLYTFDYNQPASICSIPHADRNVGLVWGVFVALLLATCICVTLWQRRKHVPAGALSKFSFIQALLPHTKLHIVRQVADRVWFLVSDVVWFIFSQVTDAITIHQVIESGHLHYAYVLLAILLIPFAFMFLLVVNVSFQGCQARIGCRTLFRRVAALLLGLIMSPLLFLFFECALLAHGIGIPLPTCVRSYALGVDMSTFYRAQSLAETFLNAVPQSVVQSKLYLMGNDPNGVHVYIDTTLFLFSITASLSSILKSIAVLMIEVYRYKLGVTEYLGKLVKFEAF